MFAKYPSVDAVVHSHSPDVVAWSNPRYVKPDLRAVLHVAGLVGNHVPIFDSHAFPHGPRNRQNFLVNNKYLGDRLADKFSSEDQNDRCSGIPTYGVVLQRCHGFVTWGTCIEDAVFRARYAQQHARIQANSTVKVCKNRSVRQSNKVWTSHD